MKKGELSEEGRIDSRRERKGESVKTVEGELSEGRRKKSKKRKEGMEGRKGELREGNSKWRREECGKGD